MYQQAVTLQATWPSEDGKRQLDGWRLNGARRDGRRLASLRRAGVAILILTGAAIIVCSQFPGAASKAVLATLGAVWLVVLPFTAVVLRAESHNARRADDLSAVAHGTAHSTR
jgi:hypothetical protein